MLKKFSKPSFAFVTRKHSSLVKPKSLVEQKKFQEFEAESEELYHKLFAGEIEPLSKENFFELFGLLDTAVSHDYKFNRFLPYKQNNKFDDAKWAIEKGLELCKNVQHKGIITISKGTILEGQGLVEEAHIEFLKGVEIIQKSLTEENAPSMAHAHLQIAKYQRKKNPLLALKHLESSLSINEHFFGWKNPLTSECAILLGEVSLENDRIDSGIIALEKAMVAIDLLEFHVMEMTRVALLLAKAYQVKKRYELQIHVLGRAMTLLNAVPEDQRTLNEFLWCEYRIQNMTAACRFLRGDIKLATIIFKRILTTELEIITKWFDVDKADTINQMAMRHFYYAMTLMTNKMYEEAHGEFIAAELVFKQASDEKFLALCKQYLTVLAPVLQGQGKEKAVENK